MEVDIAVLADAANVSSDGKVNILGAFTRLSGPRLPLVVPGMALFLRLKASSDEMDVSHHLKVVVVDLDGKPVAPAAEINPLRVPNRLPGGELEMNVILAFSSITFQRFGLHRVDIFINGHGKAQVAFMVQAVVQSPDTI